MTASCVRLERRNFLAGAALVTRAAVGVRARDAGGDGRRHQGSRGRQGDPRGQGEARPAAADRERQYRAAHRVGREPDDAEADHVKAIHVFNEKNPQPHVFDARLGPRNGKAVVATRIKLGDSQKIVAIAETSKGEFFSASADVIVTLAACLEDIT